MSEVQGSNMGIAQARGAWREVVMRQAMGVLTTLVGPQRAKEAGARLALAVQQAAMAVPELYDATPVAVANAISLSALTQLFPGGLMPDAWLIPKKGSAGGMLWMVSHRGIIKLAKRAGYEVDVVCVFEGETFEQKRTPFLSINHEPDGNVEQTWETLSACYCIFWPTNNRAEWRAYVLNKDEIAKRRAKSDTSAVWGPWWREMAMKSTIKAAAARGLLPLDDVGMLAMDHDEQQRNVIATVEAEAAPAPRQITKGLDALEEDYAPKEAVPAAKVDPAAVDKAARAPRKKPEVKPEPEPKPEPKPVEVLKDQSGNGNDVAQPDPVKQPVKEIEAELVLTESEATELAGDIRVAEHKAGATGMAAARKSLDIPMASTVAALVKHGPRLAQRYLEALVAANG